RDRCGRRDQCERQQFQRHYCPGHLHAGDRCNIALHRERGLSDNAVLFVRHRLQQLQPQLEVDEANKLPVSVTLSSGPNLLNPVDISASTSNGHVSFQYFATLPGGTPNVGDTYDFTVTYSDGSQDTGSAINGQVTAVLDALFTGLSPQGSGASTTPTFTWTYPNNASNYTY